MLNNKNIPKFRKILLNRIINYHFHELCLFAEIYSRKVVQKLITFAIKRELTIVSADHLRCLALWLLEILWNIISWSRDASLEKIFASRIVHELCLFHDDPLILGISSRILGHDIPQTNVVHSILSISDLQEIYRPASLHFSPSSKFISSVC